MGPPGDSRRAPYVESVVHLDETYSEPIPTQTPTEPPHHLAIVGSGGTAFCRLLRRPWTFLHDWRARPQRLTVSACGRWRSACCSFLCWAEAVEVETKHASGRVRA